MRKLTRHSGSGQAQKTESSAAPSPSPSSPRITDDHPDALPPEHQARNTQREQTQTLGKLVRQIAGRHRLAERITQCSPRLTLIQVRDMTTGQTKLKLAHAQFCKTRLCTVCQARRATKRRAQFAEIVKLIKTKHPSYRWLFLTLAARNVPVEQLGEELTRLNKAWDRFVKKQRWPAKGWIKSVEITRSADGTAHPHFHILLLVPSSYFRTGYIEHAEWVALWRDALRADYQPTAHIKAIKRGEQYATAEEAAALEVFKYATKTSDLFADLHFLDVIISQLRGKREIASGGIIKTALKELKTEFAETGEEAEPTTELVESELKLVYDWQTRISKYRRSRRTSFKESGDREPDQPVALIDPEPGPHSR